MRACIKPSIALVFLAWIASACAPGPGEVHKNGPTGAASAGDGSTGGSGAPAILEQNPSASPKAYVFFEALTAIDKVYLLRGIAFLSPSAKGTIPFGSVEVERPYVLPGESVLSTDAGGALYIDHDEDGNSFVRSLRVPSFQRRTVKGTGLGGSAVKVPVKTGDGRIAREPAPADKNQTAFAYWVDLGERNYELRVQDSATRQETVVTQLELPRAPSDGIVCPTWYRGEVYFAALQGTKLAIYRGQQTDDGWSVTIFASPGAFSIEYACPRVFQGAEGAR